MDVRNFTSGYVISTVDSLSDGKFYFHIRQCNYIREVYIWWMYVISHQAM